MIFRPHAIAYVLCAASLSPFQNANAQTTNAPPSAPVEPEGASEGGETTPEETKAPKTATPTETKARKTESPKLESAPPVSTSESTSQAEESKAEQGVEPISSQEERARAAFRHGDQLYLEGDYQGAVRAFEEAYALSGRIEMLFNLANAHERLGNYSEASVALRGYIPHSPDTQRRALERRLKRFEALAEQKEAAAVEAEAAAKEFPVDRAIGIGLLTLGGAGLVTGTAFAISAANTRSDLKDICVEGANGQLCPSDAESLLNRDKTYSLVADLSFIAGAALAAGGFYLIVRSGDEDGGEIRASAAPGRLLIGGNF